MPDPHDDSLTTALRVRRERILELALDDTLRELETLRIHEADWKNILHDAAQYRVAAERLVQMRVERGHLVALLRSVGYPAHVSGVRPALTSLVEDFQRLWAAGADGCDHLRPGGLCDHDDNIHLPDEERGACDFRHCPFFHRIGGAPCT